MSGGRQTQTLMDRRVFLKRASLGTAAISASRFLSASGRAVAQKYTLPTVRLGDHQVTRLITGYNPVGGFSHATPYLSRHMREYFTVERTVELLRHCEALGITTFQFDLTEKVEKVLDIIWSQGSQLQFICLHAERPDDAALSHVIKYKPIAIVHHGGVTDRLFRAGKAQQVHDFVKKVHDSDVLAGVSSHCPANVARMVDEGWENDFFMTCFYDLSRTRADMLKEFGAATVGEAFIESDPVKMTELVRQIEKPCLGFKILAAGRKCSSRSTVAEAFQFAFQNIKPRDAVIVGMFPRYQDEVREDIEHTLTYATKQYAQPA